MPKVIVIGAGIAGLGAAYALQKAGVEVSVLEAESEVGGRMGSFIWQGSWINRGAGILSTHERELADLVSELDLKHHRRFISGGELVFEIWRNGKGRPLSFTRPSTFLTSGVFSLAGKLRLCGLLPCYIRQFRRNKSIPPGAYESWQSVWADDESVETWLSRVNPQFLEYFVEPVFEFMYGYRPSEISKGWFLRNITAHQRLSIFCFSEGLGLVPRTLAKRLDVTTNARVTRVVAGKTPVSITWEQGSRSHRAEVDAVLVAVPGTKVTGLVEGLNREHARFFDAVRYSPQSNMYSKLDRRIDGLPTRRYYPRTEEANIAYIGYQESLENTKKMFFRAKMKTDYTFQQLGKSDDEELDAILGEVARYFPDAVSSIKERKIIRWQEGIAVFFPGYVRALERFLHLPPLKGVAFAGDYLVSPETGGAYRSGLRAADDLLTRLGNSGGF